MGKQREVGAGDLGNHLGDGRDGEGYLRGIGDRRHLAGMLAEDVAAVLPLTVRCSVLVGHRALRSFRRLMAGRRALPFRMRRLAGMRPCEKANAQNGEQEQG